MTREKTIKIRRSEYEYQQLLQEATRQGTGMSDVMRKCIAKFPKPQGGFSHKAALAATCFHPPSEDWRRVLLRP